MPLTVPGIRTLWNIWWSIETEYTYKYMEATASLQDGSEITEEFIHIMARAMFDSMFEVVRHRMDRDTARKYLHMLEKYHYGGGVPS